MVTKMTILMVNIWSPTLFDAFLVSVHKASSNDGICILDRNYDQKHVSACQIVLYTGQMGYFTK